MWTSVHALVQQWALHAVSPLADFATPCYSVSARFTSSLPIHEVPAAAAFSPGLPCFAVCDRPTNAGTHTMHACHAISALHQVSARLGE